MSACRSLPRHLLGLLTLLASAQSSGQGISPPMGQGPAPRAQSLSPVAPAASGTRLVPLDIQLNGVALGVWVVLQRDGAFFVQPETLNAWRLKQPSEAALLIFRNSSWVPLGSVPGFFAEVDDLRQAMLITVDSQAFAITSVGRGAVGDVGPSPVVPMAFLNSDVSLDLASPRVGPEQQILGGLFEAGVSGRWGVLTNSFFSRQGFGSFPDGDVNLAYQRLETRLTIDIPEFQLTARVGDSLSRGGLINRPVFFYGFQLGRNYALTPSIFTQPVPVIGGSAAAASTVELYINDALRRSSQVPPGPFTIDNPALFGPGGEVRLVVRDVLGRETVITRQAFSNNLLLRAGLDDFSLEAGALREGIGGPDDQYTDGFVSGVYRRGLTDALTLEANTSATRSLRMLGAGLAYELHPGLVAFGSAAGSQAQGLLDPADPGLGVGGPRTFGAATVLGAEYQRRRFGVTLQQTQRDERFQLLGLAPGLLATEETQINARLNTESVGNFGVSLASLDLPGSGRTRSLVGSYSTSVLDVASVAFTAVQTRGGVDSEAFSVSLVVPLSRGLVSSATATRREGGTDALASLSYAEGGVVGQGIRAIAGVQSETDFQELSAFRNGSTGGYSVDIRRDERRTFSRLGYRGAVVALGGKVGLTRSITGGVALVEAKGLEGVGVLLQGQEVAKLDADGQAIVAGLGPYRENPIRLEAADIPINAEVKNLETVVVPGIRSASVASFAVRSGRAVVFQLLGIDGMPLSAGTPVAVEGDRESFFVARRGEVFISSVPDRGVLAIQDRERPCRVPYELPADNVKAFVRVGPLSCSR